MVTWIGIYLFAMPTEGNTARATAGRLRAVRTVADEYVRVCCAGWTAEQFRREARERRARGADQLADRLEYEAARLDARASAEVA